MDKSLGTAGFNETAKFGFQRQAVMALPEHSKFPMYRSDKTYDVFKRSIQDFETSQLSYMQAHDKSKKEKMMI